MTIKDAPHATLIGDLVGSRRAADRRRLHGALTGALADVASTRPGVFPLRVIAGDEFQGGWASLGECLDIAFRLRIALLEAEVDVRLGVGWGTTALLADDGIEDGPGWWSARAAIEEVAALQGRAATRGVRIGFQAAPESPRPDAPAIRAALLCRDHLVSLCDDRSRRILGGLMQGESQLDLADAEGISAQAVSQRVGRDGLGLIVGASRELAALP